VLTTLERGRWASELKPYFRDVRDHLLVVNEEVAGQRDLLTTILEANIAVISVQQNEISVRQSATMERLTILATVFLPLTFVTGFFGQNFDWLVENLNTFWAFVLFGIGGLALPCLLLYYWLRHGGVPKTAPSPLPEQAAGFGTQHTHQAHHGHPAMPD